MATAAPTTTAITVLNVRAFHAACKRKGATTEKEIADLLGVDRSTIWRAVNKQQPIGNPMHTALKTVFKDDANSLTKIIKKPAAA